ncbi:MAG: DUF87 domain-containing protein [Campylobacterales bacterium]|nr:DUF87 domain-containing protein [Campylobacterales bacterium]
MNNIDLQNHSIELENKILAELGLNVEQNHSITCTNSGEKTLVTCNKKAVLTQYDANTLMSIDNYVLLDLYSTSMNCSYHLLRKHISSMISSKINILFSYLLQFAHESAYYNHNDQALNQFLLDLRNIDDIDTKDVVNKMTIKKWSDISKIIKAQPAPDVLVKLNQKFEYVVIDNEKEIDFYDKQFNIQKEKVAYIATYPCVVLSYPLYDLIKNYDSNRLLGVDVESQDVEIFKILYQYIFKEIDEKNIYRCHTKTLWDTIQKDEIVRAYKVDEIPVAFPLMLVRVFIKIANRIDQVLNQLSFMDNKLDIESKRFNLTITEEIIDSLEENKDANYHIDIENTYDALHEARSHTKLDLLNKSLNDNSTSNNTAPIEKPVNNKSLTTRRNHFLSTNFSFPYPFALGSNRYVQELSDNNFDTCFPAHARNQHTYILGGSGAGKSELIKTIISSIIEKKYISQILIDPHGDLAKQVAITIDKDRLIYFDPFLAKDKIFTINPLQIECTDEETNAIYTQELTSIFKTVLGIEWTLNMEALLVPCISTLLRKGDSDIYELQRFMNDKKSTDLLALGKKSPIKGHKDFFTDQFENEKFNTTKNAISTKLQILLNYPVFTNLITGKSTVDLEKEINTPGKIIIVRLTKGIMKTTGAIYGRFIMALIQMVALKREKIPEHLRPHTHLYIDEFQNFIGSTIEEILTESRKYKLFVTFAHQTLSQLDAKLKEIVLSNTNIKIVGKNSHKNLKVMKEEIQIDTKEMENLRPGEFYAKVGSKQAFKLKNSTKFLDNDVGIDEEKWQDNVQYQLDNYYRTIEESNSSSDDLMQSQDLKSDVAASSIEHCLQIDDF